MTQPASSFWGISVEELLRTALSKTFERELQLPPGDANTLTQFEAVDCGPHLNDPPDDFVTGNDWQSRVR